MGDLMGIGSVADFAKGIMDRFFPKSMDPAEKAQKQIELQEAISKREDTLINSQKEIIVEELKQGDSFTKRSRPMIIYSGLLFIFMNHVILPMIVWIVTIATGTKIDPPVLNLPSEFWWAWSGVCSVYVMGRTSEKMGYSNKIIQMITGSK